MLEIQGFQLDNKHILTELVDKDGEKSWGLSESTKNEEGENNDKRRTSNDT